jgi:hypothetical protein
MGETMTSLPLLMPRLRPGTRPVARLDRLGWRAGTCFDAFGVRIGVRVNEPALLERIAPHLPPGWRPLRSPLVDQIFSVWLDPGGMRESRVYAGRSRRVRTGDLGEALAVLESEMRQSVAAGARARTFVHAGVVGWHGRAIVVPGRSRSGKTTLVTELVRRGAVYLSDEFAVLDRMGRVHPFVKPLSIRGRSGCDRHARRLDVAEIGGCAGTVALPVAVVVLTEYRPASTWRPTRLTTGQAVLEMLAHTVPARLRPEASLVALERAASNAVVLKGERDEAEGVARSLLGMLDSGDAVSAEGREGSWS